MKDLIDLLTNEERDFNFPWWVYVFVVPIVMVALMGIAGWMDGWTQRDVTFWGCDGIATDGTIVLSFNFYKL
jgi:hypothetical protein